MPEGHTIHRLARQFSDVFSGQHLLASSPQGRFASGAKRINGQLLEAVHAHGKQLFLRFDNELTLRVHLGLYGAWDFGGDESFRGASSIGAPRRVGERELPAEVGSYTGPPPPLGAVRLRLHSDHGWADLRGPSVCELLTDQQLELQLSKLGPDPLLLIAGDQERFAQKIATKNTAIAALLMDQSVIAGIGNIYRAELLFRNRINPWLAGKLLDQQQIHRLWSDAVLLLERGVRDGRIITTEHSDRESSGWQHYVYQHQGSPCLICGTTIQLSELLARKLYFCPGCQQLTEPAAQYFGAAGSR